MRIVLIGLFLGIFVGMLTVTILAVQHEYLGMDVLIRIIQDPWSLATLCDAYFGFLTFFVWVAYRERQLWKKVLWFVLIMCLGNFAMSFYVLRLLILHPSDKPLETLFLREPNTAEL